MEVASQLDPARVLFFNGIEKNEALNQLVDTVSNCEVVQDVEALRQAIFDREKTLSTGIGLGIAVPHAKIEEVSEFILCVGVSSKGLEFEALDGKPVNIIALIAGPSGAQDEYLKILAHLTLFLKNRKNRKAITNADNAQEVCDLLKKADQANR